MKKILLALSAISILPLTAIAHDHESRQRDFGRSFEHVEVNKFHPHDHVEFVNRGSEYRRRGNFDLAIIDYNRAIELNPNYPLAYYNRGLLYFDNNNYDLAILDYSRALELDSNNYDIYYNRGIAYYKLGNLDLAFNDFTQVIELNPGNKYAKTYLIKIRKKLRR